MSRGRSFGQNQEWDPMRDDFDDSTYDAQYQDDEAGSDVQLNHCRLYITNIPKALNDEGLRTAFSKYGSLTEVHMSKDPLKRYGLVTYKSPGEAKLAMMKLNRTEPLKLSIAIAHKRRPETKSRERVNGGGRDRMNWDDRDGSSVCSRRDNSRKQDTSSNLGDPMEEGLGDEMDLSDAMDPDLHLELEQLKLQQLKIQEQEIQCKQRMLLLKEASKRPSSQSFAGSLGPKERSFLPDGRIVVRNVEKGSDSRDFSEGYTGGAGDANERESACCCKENKTWTPMSSPNGGSSTPSTCVFCYEDYSRKTTEISGEKSTTSKATKSQDKSIKTVDSRVTDITSKKSMISKDSLIMNLTAKKFVQSKATDRKTESRKTTESNLICKKKCLGRHNSDMTCDFKYSDIYESEEDADETNRLIQLRSNDYVDIVDDKLRIVIALAGYPKTKVRLRQMEQFQKCLADVIEMQLKNGLLRKVPSFLDYYLNRGAIVCICKDSDTRDWMVRVSPGLQERMSNNLLLLKAKVKRLCLAVLKIPQHCWPATAQDTFRLLQYFNPTLKIETWKIFAQKLEDGVETTSFIIDRESGEIIRGPTFKNVIDYNQMEFELTGYTEIYYDCLLSDLEEDLHSIASRVKLLDELQSTDNTPRAPIEQSPHKVESENKKDLSMNEESLIESQENDSKRIDSETQENDDIRKELESSLHKDVLKKLKDIQYISENNEVIVWSDDAYYYSDNDNEKKLTENFRLTENVQDSYTVEEPEVPSASGIAVSDNAESYLESNDTLMSRTSNVNIDSNRGIAYHRRTNYLHVENELKVAIVLEGYPVSKLEGTHIKRLKHLFKEYLHKDMKNQRFTNLIIPKFQDVYLSNGAVIYVCDSLETKDYLTEVLPKFINSTGLKLTFKDIKDLVRYTRVVMRVPKEHSNVESVEILLKLQLKYPNLKPDRWKYYSDVAGKQKREFGVDPESLEIIKSPDFDPTYEGDKLTFRIIDRQKKDLNYDEASKESSKNDDLNTAKLKEQIAKNMYAPLNSEILNAPLTRIRTNHYSDLIADDLKLYVGPANYPQARVDEQLFHIVRRTFETVVLESLKNNPSSDTMPKFHDMYLFDGVIFIICMNKLSRMWVERAIPEVNIKINMNLKATEFRGAVGIVSMMAKTDRDPDDVIKILQIQNPRLRTKYWRRISTVKTKTKLDIVLQIDKLSAQVITSESFNKYVDSNPVQFKLGHLQSLIKPKFSLEKMDTVQANELKTKTRSKVSMLAPKDKTFRNLATELKKKYPCLRTDSWDVLSQLEKDNNRVCDLEIDDDSAKIIQDENYKLTTGNDHVFFYTGLQSDYSSDPIVIGHDSQIPSISVKETNLLPAENDQDYMKMIVKIPVNILPDNKEDLNIIFDLLEDKNPGLNTEIWKIFADNYPDNGRLVILVDTQSASIMKSKSFDSTIGGEKLRFYF